jgi:uncharacterized protein
MYTIALPTSDRPTTHRFYTEGLGLEAFGAPADDGVPEPLQLRLGAEVTLMFIPTGGFGWVTAGHETAPAGVSECLLSIDVEDSDEEVDAVLARAVAAGATVVTGAVAKPWGYLATFADPDQHLWQVINPG